MSGIKIRKLKKSDYNGWLYLYKTYADFYKTSLTDIGVKKTWNWLQDPSHPCTGIIAEQQNKLIAFAHFRAMPSPLRGENIGFLDDLYVLPDNRGGKVVELLFKELRKYSKDSNWKIIRWITRDDNYRAKGVYDRISSKTNWDLYEMKI